MAFYLSLSLLSSLNPAILILFILSWPGLALSGRALGEGGGLAQDKRKKEE